MSKFNDGKNTNIFPHQMEKPTSVRLLYVHPEGVVPFSVVHVASDDLPVAISSFINGNPVHIIGTVRLSQHVNQNPVRLNAYHNIHKVKFNFFDGDGNIINTSVYPLTVALEFETCDH